jgi:hypothetical protein
MNVYSVSGPQVSMPQEVKLMRDVGKGGPSFTPHHLQRIPGAIQLHAVVFSTSQLRQGISPDESGTQ